MAPESEDDLDAAARAWFEPLRVEPDGFPAHLTDRTLDGVHASIAAQNLIELGTTVVVRGFLGPILDLFASALGLDREEEPD